MPVNTPHPQYAARAAEWQRVRDCVAGADAVKAAGTRYLPALDAQSAPDYEAYVRRAMFYTATDRTVAGLTGLVLRKPATVEVPLAVEPDLSDLTLAGESWAAVQLDALKETLEGGRLGILIDWQDEAGRAAWTLFPTEAIVNWRTGKLRGPDGQARIGLTRLVLMETVTEPDPKDDFVEKRVLQYRVFELVPVEDPRDPLAQQLRVGTWRRAEGQAEDKWVEVGVLFPERNGAPVPAIPFVAIGARKLGIEPEKPPVLDLVDVNLSHYRSSADLEHGRHYTALPTPWVAGFTHPIPNADPLLAQAGDSPPKAFKLGPAELWVFRSEGAKVGMLEFTGTGLAAIERALEHKERLMAILGARLLEGTPMRGETAEAVRLRHAGDAATLTTVAASLSEGFTLAFRWHAWWARDDKAFDERADIHVAMNTDFFSEPVDAAQAKTMVETWQAGGMAWATLYQWMERAELTREGVTAEEEMEEIQREQAAYAPDSPDDVEPSAPEEDPDAAVATEPDAPAAAEA